MSTCFRRSTNAEFRRQRTQRRLLVKRVSRLQGRERCFELVQEFVGEFVDDDEALRGATGLPGIVHPPPNGPLDRVFEIGVVEDDKCVTAAELHRRGLEVLSGSRCDALARRDAAGQRHAFDAGVVDDAIRLIMRDQEIGVEPDGRARLDPKLLEGDPALRNDARMFHQQDIARHKVRTGDASELIVGKVPRLDAEDDAERAALHMAVAKARVEFDIRQETLGILGVIGEDAGAEFDLSDRFADALAHLERHDVRQFLGLFVHEGRRSRDNFRPFAIRLAPPDLVAGRGGRNLALEFLVGEFLERLQHFAVGGVDALVAHGLVLLGFIARDPRDVRYCRQASMITLSAFVFAAWRNVS